MRNVIHRNDTDCNRCTKAYKIYINSFYLITTGAKCTCIYLMNNRYCLICKFKLDLNLSCAKDFQNLKIYGDMVYKLKKIVGSNSFSVQLIKIIFHYKKIGYNITGPSKKLFHYAIFQKFFHIFIH